MALATLNGIPFRINPAAIEWAFSIDTNVIETIGGRVVQVIGATLTDLSLSGDYGERKGYESDKHHHGRELHGGGLLSWELAEAFLDRARQMMDKQSSDSRKQGLMHEPLDFRFPDYGWHYGVYLKGIDDGQSNQAVSHSAGHFAYTYRLSLFIVEDRSDDIVVASGRGTSLTNQKRAAAINGYISRISKGVGWRLSRFNDPNAITNAVTGETSLTSTSGTVPLAKT